ncbi:MAG: aspartate dehydrogenase [Candidatus Duberdicusella sinuisediminis]|nr:MAG: aspartate dehydrogenase [Candidatus Omnitrophota bacterium]
MKKLGILGCGAIGEGVALFVEKELSSKVKLSSLLDKERRKAQALKSKLGRSKPVVVDSLDSLFRKSDLILESASWRVVRALLEKALSYRKDLIILSVGGLLSQGQLLKKAEKKGINIYLPSGAICGIDGVLASSCAKIKKCLLITSKPPQGFKGVEYIKNKKINLNTSQKKILFRGKAEQAFKYFPQNINVASTLLFASKFKDLQVEIVLEPRLKRNTHKIYLLSQIGEIEVKVENVPSILNPKTSSLTIASAQALLRKMFSSLKIGT